MCKEWIQEHIFQVREYASVKELDNGRIYYKYWLESSDLKSKYGVGRLVIYETELPVNLKGLREFIRDLGSKSVEATFYSIYFRILYILAKRYYKISSKHSRIVYRNRRYVLITSEDEPPPISGGYPTPLISWQKCYSSKGKIYYLSSDPIVLSVADTVANLKPHLTRIYGNLSNSIFEVKLYVYNPKSNTWISNNGLASHPWRNRLHIRLWEVNIEDNTMTFINVHADKGIPHKSTNILNLRSFLMQKLVKFGYKVVGVKEVMPYDYIRLLKLDVVDCIILKP